MQHVSYMYVRLSHFLPYLRMGYCIARIRISCTFVPNVLTTEKSNRRSWRRRRWRRRHPHPREYNNVCWWIILFLSILLRYVSCCAARYIRGTTDNDVEVVLQLLPLKECGARKGGLYSCSGTWERPEMLKEAKVKKKKSSITDVIATSMWGSKFSVFISLIA